MIVPRGTSTDERYFLDYFLRRKIDFSNGVELKVCFSELRGMRKSF